MSVLAHHLVWTAYGTWLGNDPRGSGSRNVYTPVLASLGEVHYGRRSVQPSRPTVREFYMEATPRLQFPVVRFDDALIQVIGRVFSDIVIKHRYTCYACAIMPDHVHLVIRKHRDQGKAMIEHFQRESRLRFSSLGVVCPDHPVWTNGGWDRFLDSTQAIRGRIRYVGDNPEKAGLRRQAWPFVVAYDGWPLHKKRPPR
jgi:REP element-mobilizing transposase RayT